MGKNELILRELEMIAFDFQETNQKVETGS